MTPVRVLFFPLFVALITACSNDQPAVADSGTPTDTGTGHDANETSDSGAHADSSVPSDSGMDLGVGDMAIASDLGEEPDAAIAEDADVDAGPTYGYCTKPCGTVADCCPAGAPDCPSLTYPNNYTCIEGACHAPVCSTDEECMTENPATACMTTEGATSCLLVCTIDDDCPGALTCAGVADDGRKYCRVVGGPGCSDDASCYGFGHCVDHLCVCASASDCEHPTFSACAL